MEVIASEVEQLNTVFGSTPHQRRHDVIDEVPEPAEETRETVDSVPTQPDTFEKQDTPIPEEVKVQVEEKSAIKRQQTTNKKRNKKRRK